MKISAPWWLQVDIPIGIFLMTALGALLLALMKGGDVERRGGYVLLTMATWQYSASFFVPPHFAGTDDISLIGDAIGLGGFAVIALNARRTWPIWASAFQLLSLSGHFARSVELSFAPIIYAWMRTLPTAGAILALLFGTIFHMARARRFGADPSWQDWSQIEQRASIRRHLKSSRR